MIAALIQQEFIHHPTAAYTKLQHGGFTIYVSPDAKKNPISTDPALKMMREAITQFSKLVPKSSLITLRKAPIWVEHLNPGVTSCCFHESVDWLRENGFNTDKAKAGEVGSPINYVNWTKLNQPFQLFHEFAHAYHSIRLGFEDPTVKAAYQAAVDSKKYEAVKYNLGGNKRAYALNNQMEYFAELSEAYFGVNDFYPFTRAELKSFDPKGYAMIEWAWKLPAPK